MSVLIKGMGMPKTAGECSVKIDPDTRRCIYTGKEFEETLSLLLSRRCADCPLIEVPTPHGRLIDADFEEAYYTSMTVNPTPDVTDKDKRNSLIIIEALQMAKTIIEAEGSEA